jgi:type IV pilus assembly protein PilA
VIAKREQVGKLYPDKAILSNPPLKETVFMKLEFQAKFLQHLNKKKKQEEGFTLIELLVVIIIIGILAAIALPSLLSQVNKGKQAEAKQNVGTMNRSQQAYFLEADSFATELTELGVGIKTQTVNYKYTIKAGPAVGPTNSIGQANNIGTAIGKTLKSYVGQNFTNQPTVNNAASEVLTLAFACETQAVGDQGAAAADGAAFAITDSTGCPDGFKDLSGTKRGTGQ